MKKSNIQYLYLENLTVNKKENLIVWDRRMREE